MVCPYLTKNGHQFTNNETSLTNELYQLGETLNELLETGPKDMRIKIVKSNHDEALDKYLDEGRYGTDPQNLALSVRLANGVLDGKDAVQYGVQLTHGKLDKRIDFLQRDDDFNRYGWHLSSHGDKGPSGSRGSMPSFDYSLGKAVVAHNHSACIRKNVFRVGALEKTDVKYAAGTTNNWTATNFALYPNGRGQLLNIYNQSWGA